MYFDKIFHNFFPKKKNLKLFLEEFTNRFASRKEKSARNRASGFYFLLHRLISKSPTKQTTRFNWKSKTDELNSRSLRMRIKKYFSTDWRSGRMIEVVSWVAHPKISKNYFFEGRNFNFTIFLGSQPRFIAIGTLFSLLTVHTSRNCWRFRENRAFKASISRLKISNFILIFLVWVKKLISFSQYFSIFFALVIA